MLNRICNFFIVKLKDQYYILEESRLSEMKGPFHTSELAHLWLIEKAKEESIKDKILIQCLEVEKQYVFFHKQVSS